MENNNNSRIKNMTASVNEDNIPAQVPRSQRVAPSMRSGSSARERSFAASSPEVRSNQQSPAKARSSHVAPAASGISGQKQRTVPRQAGPAGSRGNSTPQKKRPAPDTTKKTVSQKKKAVSSTNRKRKQSRTWFGKQSKYVKFLIIYGVAFAVLIIIAAIVLTSYLRRFEAGQPSHAVEAVITSFGSEEKLNRFLSENKDIIDPDMEGLEDTYYPLIEGKELNFVNNSDNTTQETASYYITADNSRVAAVTLVNTGSDSWELSRIDLSEAYIDAKSYSILVPEGSTVLVNGAQLGTDKITGTGIPEIIEYSSQFLNNKPEYTTYTVKSITGVAPSVSGTDSSGQELVFSESDSLFVAGGGANEQFIDSVKERVEDGVEEYALYFEYLAFDLSDYIVSDSLMYEQIFGSENYDRIDPSLYMFEYINTYEFAEKSITNYTVYSDECFTCDVKFSLLITFNQEGIYGHKDLPDDNISVNATWVWVKDGDTWKIADSVLKG